MMDVIARMTSSRTPDTSRSSASTSRETASRDNSGAKEPPVVIERVRPEVDEGRYPAKTIAGEPVVVEADAYSHGHDVVAVDLLHRYQDETEWRATPMVLVDESLDRWRAEYKAESTGEYVFTIRAWMDPFATWQGGFKAKVEAGEATDVDMAIGADLLTAAAGRAAGDSAKVLQGGSAALRRGGPEGTAAGLDEKLAQAARPCVDPASVSQYLRELSVVAERRLAAFGSWYEMFPRSASPDPSRSGTFRDVEARLTYVRDMGFDVLYLPPIHPIGNAFKKGKNNSPEAGPDEPGSPWAIGSKDDGGHKSVNPDLGTLEDFRQLVGAANEMGIEIALDAAFQCSPDHPYVAEHPEWFKYRPDGTIQYAENPPKKYQDVVPFDWETPAREALWNELKSIFLYWIEQGVKIFRVDNPHTKPFEFWEWCIREVRKVNPDAIFLAEAFTRLRVMNRLSQVGFTQSYTNFAWSHTKMELTDYFTQLTTPPVVDYFRPNAWPNTPDILADYLREGHRSGFIARLILAATLSPSYGIYGPVYELIEHAALGTGSEDDYANSEKYEVRHWDLDQSDSLRGIIAAINKARHENPALQTNPGLRFHQIDNDQVIAYSRTSPDGSNVVLCVVNMHPTVVQSGDLHLPWRGDVAVEELLSGENSIWKGPQQTFSLDPNACPALVFRVKPSW